MPDKELRQLVIDAFKEYGGWWSKDRMAEWCNTDTETIRIIYDELEIEGLLERRLRCKE